MKKPETLQRTVKQATIEEGCSPHAIRHKRVTLEDGRKFLECNCGKTIAYCVIDSGRHKVKIILRGSRSRDTSIALGGR